MLISVIIGILGSIIGGAIAGTKITRDNYHQVAKDLAQQIKGDVTTWRDQIQSKIMNNIVLPSASNAMWNKLNNQFDRKMSELESRGDRISNEKDAGIIGADPNDADKYNKDVHALKSEYTKGLQRIKDAQKVESNWNVLNTMNKQKVFDAPQIREQHRQFSQKVQVK